MPAGDYYHSDPRVRIHRRGKLANLRKCPARHWSEQQGQVSTADDPEPRDRGTLFHSCVEAILSPHRGKFGVPSLTPAEAVLAKAPAKLAAEVRELLGKWWGRWPAAHIIECENLLTSRILRADESPDGLEHHVGGVLDLVTHPCQVWDWKTGYFVPSEKAVGLDLQTCSYALLASDRFGWTEVDVCVDYVRWGVTRTTTYNLEAIRAIEQVLKAWILEYLAWEREVFEADPGERRPGKHCVGCPLLATCDARAPDAIAAAGDAERIAAKLDQIEIQGDHLRTVLAEYLAESRDGRVTAGGSTYSVELQGESKIEDLEAFAGILQRLGIDFWGYLKLNDGKIGTLVKNNAKVRDAVKHLWKDKRRTKLIRRASQ